LKRHFPYLSSIFFFLFNNSCTDSVTPEFNFREGLIFIEGFASTIPGNSFVAINESAIEFGVYVVNFVEDAKVSFDNVDTNESILLNGVKGVYQAPDDFVVKPGERWKLSILLPNGKRYESTPEMVLESVPIDNLEANYDSQLTFDVGLSRLIAGHSAKISFTDPVEDINYYYWTYRTFENLDYCERCVGGYFREECISFSGGVSGIPYLDYTCESDCWRIRFPQSISIFSDEFTNGKTVNDFEIGNLLLYNTEDMVLEVQQISLTPAAYEYYKVLKDLIDNNSGLNAPPPAALVGNLFNPVDSEDIVFGRFTPAAASTTSLFIDRSDITDDTLENFGIRIFEQFEDVVPGPPKTTTSCEESKFRTAIIPPGWIDN